jgi:hypothetical protein
VRDKKDAAADDGADDDGSGLRGAEDAREIGGGLSFVGDRGDWLAHAVM